MTSGSPGFEHPSRIGHSCRLIRARRRVVDSSVALAYLVGSEQTSPLAEQLFDAFVATGRNPASLSMVTVQEILVRPFRGGTAAVATAFVTEVDCLVTNDRSWPAAAAVKAPNLRLCLLADLAHLVSD